MRVDGVKRWQGLFQIVNKTGRIASLLQGGGMMIEKIKGDRRNFPPDLASAEGEPERPRIPPEKLYETARIAHQKIPAAAAGIIHRRDHAERPPLPARRIAGNTR
jgi:hypothetical protein